MKPSPEHPVVISILTLRQRDLLSECLESLFRDRPRVPFLVHVFDQASTDGTREMLAGFVRRYPNEIVVHRHHENTGFVGGNNIVFGTYPASDIVILNDDTYLLPGWLDALHERAYSGDDIGIVGARLVYPNGELQEAGGEIFSDASGTNHGRWDDPARPEYLVARDVQYCSGALLYIKREVLDACGGGFDPRLQPAYYEDTDLCFAARRHGYRVVYEPRSVIVHREGATAGTDLTQGMKRYQEVNRHYFREKWAHVLAGHRRGRFSHPGPARGRHVLFVHLMPPLHDQASGDRRLFEMLKSLVDRHRVTFLAVDDRGLAHYTRALRDIGVHAVANDVPRWPAYGRSGDWNPACCPLEDLLRDNDFDLAVLEFYHQGRVYLSELRRLAPGLPVIVDSVDVHFVRERREAEVKSDPLIGWRAASTFRNELAVYERADAVITVTGRDGDALRAVSPGLDVRVVPNLHDVVDVPAPRDQRAGLLFVGGFRHPPNVDGATWFCREVLPLVRARKPDVPVTIAGSDPPAEVQALAGPGVEVTGFVPHIEPVIDRALVSIAPLRYGAGMKGKVAEALGRGIPVVTTSCGAEGMDLVDGEHALIADTPEAFADAICRALDDTELWQRLSEGGRRHVAARWSVEAVSRMLDDLVTRAPAVAGRRPGRHVLAPGGPAVPKVPGVLGAFVLGSSPAATAAALGRLRAFCGAELDAVVAVPRAALQDWEPWAEKDGYRLLPSDGGSLSEAAASVAPQLAGDELVVVDDVVVAFRHTFERLREALARGGAPAVRAGGLRVSTFADGSGELREAAAARVLASGHEPAPGALLFLAQAGRPGFGEPQWLERAAVVSAAHVLDPRLPPAVFAEVSARPGLTVVRLVRDAAAPEPRPGVPDGITFETVRTGGGRLGARLAEAVRRGNREHLLVVDEAIRIELGDVPNLLAALGEPRTMLRLRPEWLQGSAPAEARLLGQRLAADLPGQLPLLSLYRPSFAVANAFPGLFDERLDGIEVLLEAGLRLPGAAKPRRQRIGLLAGVLGPDDLGGPLVEFVAAAAPALARRNARLDALDADGRYTSLFRYAASGSEAFELLAATYDALPAGADLPWNGLPLRHDLLLLLCQVLAAHAVLPVLDRVLDRTRQDQHLAWSSLDRASWPARAAGNARAILALARGFAGDAAGARRDADAAALGAPRHYLPQVALAHAELMAGRADEALAALAKARALATGKHDVDFVPQWPAFLRGLLLEAKLLVKTGRPGQLLAIAQQLEGRRVRPGGHMGAEFLRTVAEAHAQLGDAPAAALARLNATALFPQVTDRAPVATSN